MALKVTSAAFDDGQPIPRKFAYKPEGKNASPPLAWSGAPEKTITYALICDDPDAPSRKNPRPGGWVHWVVFNIPADKAGIKKNETGFGVDGTSDFKHTGWGGPLPPPGSGPHRYFFRVYALDIKLALEPGADKPDVIKAMKGHILAEGEVHGTYERN